jgi:MOSC domain-containing protein YiiM
VSGFISSIQIGRARELTDANGKVWRSAIVKTPVVAPVQVDGTHIVGDEQADRVHHGGPDKAVLAYSAEHFPAWKIEFQEFELATELNGAFGENLTIEGLTEVEVCIGDVYAVGSAELQVSQPRQPCWKLSRLWKLPKLAVRVQQTGRTGWYFRVVEVGQIRSGDALLLKSRPFPEWTVEKAYSVMHAKPRSSHNDRLLAGCPALSDSWKTTLLRRATAGKQPEAGVRLYGEDH